MSNCADPLRPLTDRAGVAAGPRSEVADTGDLLDHDALAGRPTSPGAGASFRVVMKDPAATAGPAYGALPISLSAAGARITSFVTYQRRRGVRPLQLAVVAPLTLAPTRRWWAITARTAYGLGAAARDGDDCRS